MIRGKASTVVLALLCALVAAQWRVRAEEQPSPTPAPTRESAATVVVYNNFDPDSVSLAAYYATRRGIPLDHIIGLDCASAEEITRAQYDTTIAEPLRKIFTERGWWHVPADPGVPVSDNQIRFIALMRGIPLKIAATTNYPGDSYTGKVAELNTNAAAVDSELATLGVRTHRISGVMRNLYFKSFTPFMDTPLAPFMLVCRLDGPTPASVRAMIDGAITAEHRGLYGFAYINLRGITSGPMAIGDQWLATAAVALRQYGMPVIWDTGELYPADYPMEHAAVYLGWYADTVQGPMARDDFQFEPGAVAVHIHSYSAASLRNPKGNWAGPLVAHGAAATIGNVYEPYLGLTPHLDVFVDRLRNGFNFAESAYASEQALSWMTTFVGDPLYRPFGEIDDPQPGSDEKPASEYVAYREGAHVWYEKGRAAGEKALETSAKELNSGIIWEGLGLLQWSLPDNDAAVASFRQAEACYGVSEDGARTALHQVTILKNEGNGRDAKALATKALVKYADFQGAELLRAVAGVSGSTPVR